MIDKFKGIKPLYTLLQNGESRTPVKIYSSEKMTLLIPIVESNLGSYSYEDNLFAVIYVVLTSRQTVC